MKRFKSARHAQCFLSTHSRIHNHFQLRRHHLVPISIVRLAMPPFARGAMSPKLLPLYNLQSRIFRPSTPATGNLTAPVPVVSTVFPLTIPPTASIPLSQPVTTLPVAMAP